MTLPASPIRLYRYELSGHSHRVELFLSLLKLPYELVDVDLLKGAHKTEQFIAKSPLAQVPVIEDGDFTQADSCAILVYLAKKYDTSDTWLPSDPSGAAQIQRWLSVAAGELAAGPNSARLVTVFGSKLDHERAKAISTRLFGILDKHLSDRTFLTGARPTIADVAIYTYTERAPEGGVSLEEFNNVRGWLKRVEALPGFVAMKNAPARTHA